MQKQRAHERIVALRQGILRDAMHKKFNRRAGFSRLVSSVGHGRRVKIAARHLDFQWILGGSSPQRQEHVRSTQGIENTEGARRMASGRRESGRMSEAERVAR